MRVSNWNIANNAKKNIIFIFHNTTEIHRIGARLDRSYGSDGEVEEYDENKDYPMYILVSILPDTLPIVMDYLDEISKECEYLIKEGDNWYALYEDYKVEIRFEVKEMFEAH